MKAVIVCNGEIKDYGYHKKFFEGVDLVVCADGGAMNLRKLGVRPDVLIGDFDSISDRDYEFFKESGVEIIRFPVEKDMTDTELAINFAIERSCSLVVLLGGFGTRLDHSLANVFLLKKLLDHGARGVIANEFNEITLIKDKIELAKEDGVRISLLPLTEEVKGVTTKGLYYPLNNATIRLGQTWGVSNEFVADLAEITVKEGLLLVVKSRER